MDMILYAANPIAFAAGIAGDFREVCVCVFAYCRIQERLPVFCTEDEMDDGKA